MPAGISWSLEAPRPRIIAQVVRHFEFQSPPGGGVRSVVQSDILSERPATHAIILMAWPIKHNAPLSQLLKRTRAGPPARVNGLYGKEASPCV